MHEDSQVMGGKIAIVGLSLRAPGATNALEFWGNLRDGVESIQVFEESELIAAGTPAEWLRDPHFVRAGGLIKNGEFFDSDFFGFTENEANITDPQQRVFLECAWEALEDAGYAGEDEDAKVGIYAGAGYSSYWLENVAPSLNPLEMASRYNALLANDKDFLTSRVAYKLNFKGPAVTVQSACSTSLVAVHLACQSLLSGDCDLALAGGVAIRSTQPGGYLYEEGMILSPDGHCRAFDVNASGTVPGSGAGIVVLKRLEDAVADGDCIRAVILASALNNDGSRKMGFTAPGVEGQAVVIEEALAVSGISLDSISYIEAHGTGTAVGDPIEIAALNKAFEASAHKPASIAVGSLKANIGHTDAAAGVLGLIKTVLMLQERQIPPTPHFRQPNLKADFSAGPFYVNARLREWTTDKEKRRAGVSSFGLGGTNAHLILEEAPPVVLSTNREALPQLLMLSAKSCSALDTATTKLVNVLREGIRVGLADVAFTLCAGRRALPFRRAVVGRNPAHAVNLLSTALSGSVSSPGRLALLFAGEGSLSSAVMTELLEREPVFHEWMKRGEEILPGSLFAQEYALAKLWLSWGLRPETMFGYGMGEYVAACLAGVFSFEDGMRMAAAREQLLADAPLGVLVAVSLSERKLQSLLNHGVSIYATHAPSENIVAVEKVALASLVDRLSEEKVQHTVLTDSHRLLVAEGTSFHEFASSVSSVKLKAPEMPFLSSVTGRWIREEEATDHDYWLGQIAKPVRLSESLDKLFQESSRILLEVGPAQTLARVARQHPGRMPRQIVASSLEGEPLLDALGQIWMAGVDLDWKRFANCRPGRRISLPTYPFERKRHWIDRPSGTSQSVSSEGKKLELDHWFYVPSWKRSAPVEMVSPVERIWLLLADDCGLALHIARWLEEQGRTAIVVEPGKRLSATGTDYTFNMESSQDYEELFAALGDERFPEVIVHCLQVSDGQSKSGEGSSFNSFTALAKVLDGRKGTRPLRIDMISTGVQVVIGHETVHPHKALAIGAALAMEQEFIGVRCRSIDMEFSSSSDFHDSEIEALQMELATPPVACEVALRGTQRWERIYERITLPAPQTVSERDAVYLITGGQGAIGMKIADYLVNKTGAKVVLVSRRKVEREASSSYLMLQADVADEGQFRDAWSLTEARYGRVDYVIHAAGLVDTGSFHLLAANNSDRVEAHFRPKVFGTEVISRLVAEKKPRMCLLFSSLSSVLGGVGYASYAAANRFLDAWAERTQNTNVTKWLAIDWDGWTFSHEQAVRRGKSADLTMSAEEGVEAFARILFAQRNLARVIVSTGDLDLRLRQRVRSHIAEEADTAAITAQIDNGNEMKDTEQRLAAIWHSVLGGKPVSLTDNLFDRGGDSLHAAQILSRVRQAFHVELPIEVIFRNQTVDSLAREVDRARAIADEETVEIAI